MMRTTAYLLLGLTLAALPSVVEAEVPPPPSLAAQYQQADVVVVVEVLAIDTFPIVNATREQIIVCSVQDVLKRHEDATFADEDPRVGEEGEGRFLTLLARPRPEDQPQYLDATTLPLEFVVDQQYVLFLTPTITRATYTPAAPEAEAVAWSRQVRADIERLREYLEEKAVQPWQWKIPAEAEEREVPKNPGDSDQITRAAEYSVGDELVGRRKWYDSGELALEEPMRLGFRHGIERYWYPSGEPWRLAHYRDGDLHGYVLQWDADGTPQAPTYWIGGSRVDGETYREAAAEDPSLPALPKAE